MRLILRWLAFANLRWADADLARADRLQREVDAAHDAAAVRLRLCSNLLVRTTARA